MRATVWCSLGLAHLAGGSATIETRLGAIDDHAVIRIDNGKLLDTDYVVYFPDSDEACVRQAHLCLDTGAVRLAAEGAVAGAVLTAEAGGRDRGI